MKIIHYLSIAMTLTACSADLGPIHIGAGKDGVNANNDNKSLTYNLTENGCSTGEKTFSSQDSLCEGLRNDALNNHCARGLRYNHFKQECPGRSWN